MCYKFRGPVNTSATVWFNKGHAMCYNYRDILHYRDLSKTLKRFFRNTTLPYHHHNFAKKLYRKKVISFTGEDLPPNSRPNYQLEKLI